METPTQQPAALADDAPHSVALAIAGMMKTFGSGEMSALRRLDSAAVVPAYWRLAARHPVLEQRRESWSPIVQALALLTPKGPPEERGELHDPERKLGTALCDGGQASWPTEGDARPLLSEPRFARLLAARGRQRQVLLLRAVRMLAASREPGQGVDVGDLAWRFVDADPQRLAAPYYQRLDRAERLSGNTPIEKGPGDE